jgi:hypothetical protein
VYKCHSGVAGCLARSSSIQIIEFQGLTLSIDGMRFLARVINNLLSLSNFQGLGKNASLVYLSFVDCIMGDDEFMCMYLLKLTLRLPRFIGWIKGKQLGSILAAM